MDQNNISSDAPVLSEFPTTRFQGSKRKLIPWIWDVVREIPFHTALDAFGGTASVSYLLKRMSKSVTYNDRLHFNYLIGKALIENNVVKLRDDEADWLLTAHDGVRYSTFIADQFGSMYYLDDENKWLDMVNTNILNLNHSEPDQLIHKKSLAYYALFQASLSKRPFNLFHRRNLSLRTRDVKRKFGNKTTWDTDFSQHFRRFVNEANAMVIPGDGSALNVSAFDIDSVGYDMVYLDPPYLRPGGSNETSNYYRCYHFLEGMSLYESWPSILSEDTKAWNDDFAAKNIHITFERLIEKFKGSTLIVSYKRGGIPSVEFIGKLLKKIGKRVHTRSVHYSYALNRQNGDARKNREVLIIGR